MAHAVAAAIEAAGSLLLVGFVLATCGTLARGGGPDRARLLIAEGAILALRTALKRAFTAEAAALAANGRDAPGPRPRP